MSNKLWNISNAKKINEVTENVRYTWSPGVLHLLDGDLSEAMAGLVTSGLCSFQFLDLRIGICSKNDCFCCLWSFHVHVHRAQIWVVRVLSRSLGVFLSLPPQHRQPHMTLKKKKHGFRGSNSDPHASAADMLLTGPTSVLFMLTLLFYCCDRAPWPRQLTGESVWWLQRVHGGSKGMTAGAADPMQHARNRTLGMAVSF